MKIRFSVRGSGRNFLFDSFGPEMKIKKKPCDGGYPKRTKQYISSLTLAGYSRSKMKISLNLRGGISTQRPKIVILSNSYGSFLFDSCGPGVIIRTNPCDGGFPIRTKLYISSLRLAGFARSGVKITFNLHVRSGISTKCPKSLFSVTLMGHSALITVDLE